MQAFIHGVILAIGLILPLGVQNLFVFNQGVTQPSFFRALPAIITASMCDTLLILISVHGISLLLLSFGFLKIIMAAFGAVFLCYIGWLTWNNTAVNNDRDKKSLSSKQQIIFAVTVSLLNPHAILDTIGVIGTSSVNYQGDDKLLFTAACIIISWAWFFFLAILGRGLGSQNWFIQYYEVINRFSAILIWGSAVYIVLTML
ncbi:LysE/ArgO family amino acid transporter [Dendrosporobacter sp. 1207_IL3150]|uniref:LysE/ArgO family amino acid transporter n=1 Tax=Dendrosporobacter sp. 1207_IL3150 TaxID=3084054 RepID=UPI002FDAFF90